MFLGCHSGTVGRGTPCVDAVSLLVAACCVNKTLQPAAAGCNLLGFAKGSSGGFCPGITRRVLQHCQGVACRSVSLGVICTMWAGCAGLCWILAGHHCLASARLLHQGFIVLVLPCAPALVSVCMTYCCPLLAHGESPASQLLRLPAATGKAGWPQLQISLSEDAV